MTTLAAIAIIGNNNLPSDTVVGPEEFDQGAKEGFFFCALRRLGFSLQPANESGYVSLRWPAPRTLVATKNIAIDFLPSSNRLGMMSMRLMML